MDSLSSLLYSCAFILLLNPLTCFCSQGDGAEAKDHHVVSVQSLLPKDVCSPSKELDPSKLEVVHRHGPCSPHKHKPAKPTHKKILDDDQHRVDWLRRQASGELATVSNRHGRPGPLPGTKIPARDGTSLGSGNYIISVGFGTPKITQSVVLDTGSDLTWIQCQPCVSICYQQQDTLFDPSKSSTYRNISCASKFCSALDASGCAGSTCLYAVQYGDSSFTVGFFAQETLTLTPSYVIPNFRFGCGEKNNGLFGQVAGLLGLGRRQQVSMVSQAAQRIGNVFSYCLPSSTSSTGYLTFGHGSTANVRYTPMLSSSDMPTFYLLEIMSISVGGHRLPISPVIFSKARTIIDSGTVITRLPPTAYTALRTAFRAQMKRYPAAPAASILDTCYDLSGFAAVRIPAVAVEYRGPTAVSLDPSGIMYLVNAKQACLAFAPNGDDTDMVIIGNTQQRRLNVVYDVGRKLIGFGAGSC